MRGTFEASEAVELAHLTRSGFIESRHSGSAVVVHPDGLISRSVGNPDAPIIPRSCLKPFQALAVAEALAGAGVELTPLQTVLSTASHAGTPEHLVVVQSILDRAGLTPDALQCPHDWPGDSGSRDALVRAGSGRASLYMNCSGKHAAMLFACVVNGWPTASYLELAHPLQQRILSMIELLTGESVSATAVDGCGAPVHAISLVGLARGISRITSSTDGAARFLTDSVLANGWAIDGPGRANTVCIDELGVFSKLGAEGVMVMAAPDGTTVALKMLDGSLRAASLVGLSLLVSAGALAQADVDRVLPTLDLTIYGGTEPVGAIQVSSAVVAL
ncbi:asparaginase [Subtercola frigoramans]|uniref:L-asparaginase II n=1 Tax=Subtercola frigoramans TaxID=120298 RepID=A0ABS2L4D1_9MICO|nr:asparaginase [Subtercola frigoramans]MBM7471957.1 L-asparaginase II [Subtercola frigoramans]